MVRAAAGSALLLALAALPAGAYVEAIYPLQQVIAESSVIVEGVVEKHDPEKKIAFIKTGRALKGKCKFEMIRVTYGGGQFWHPQAIPKHLVPGAPTLTFYNDGLQSQTYLNRFFFQMYGDGGAPPEKAWWSFTHIEIRMNRTFNGTVPELAKVVQEVLAGKAKAPAPVAKIPPMDLPHVLALPAHPEPQEVAKLPLPFRPFDPSAKAESGAIAVGAEGFLSRWLAFGPVPLGDAASDPNAALSKEWIPGLRGLKPSQHQKAAVGQLELRWEVADATDYYLDLGAAENTAMLLLSYVHADEDIAEAWLLTGSDDHGAWWVNGTEVQRFVGGRGVGKDQERTAKPLALKKGVNVVAAVIINGGGPTAACARFVGKDNQPLMKLKCSAEAPQ